MSKGIEDLPHRIQVALREAMPTGAADLTAFINSPWAALGNRSVVQTLEEDGYAAESSIIAACAALKTLSNEASSRGVL
jgi:hypothetical protein